MDLVDQVMGGLVTTVSPRILMGAGVLAVVLSLLAIGGARELWQTCLGMALMGLSAALLHAPATTLIREQGFRARPPTLGGSFSLYTLAYAGGLAIGPLLTGFAVQHAGFAAAMVIAAVALAALGALSLPRLPVTAEAASQAPDPG
ncbi:MFS transporter [Brachybacterium hainanense]|uniref:MFS transporter n=1 Tax=Brachybacterium hainanense TaxID=1541174 RepID=A0ABV6RA02_9MICO